MKWKAVSILSLVLIIPLVVMWLVQGRNIYTKDKVQVSTKVKDEIFGGESEKIEWVEKFQLGLLPGVDEPSPKVLLSVSVPSGILVAIAIFGLWKDKRSKL
ncbi:MAG: hypothetical protein IPM69_13980 [Ignavibacteria bacterium]|nr:hypothetical protein [Ignavibacteria bacterium]